MSPIRPNAISMRISLDSSFVPPLLGVLLEKNSFGAWISGLAGYRIESARVKGMATAYSLQAKPDSANRSVNLNRFAHIFRTCRVIPA